MNEFEGISPNVVKCSSLYFLFPILKTKNPHDFEVNDTDMTITILILQFNIFGLVVERKADLGNGGRLLIFSCIDNEVLEKWLLFVIFTLFFTADEVDASINFPDFLNFIVDYAYAFLCPHFSELSFGVVSQVEVKKLHCLLLGV